MKKKTAKMAPRKLALRAESIAELTAPQLAAVAGGAAQRDENSEFGGCTSHTTFSPGI